MQHLKNFFNRPVFMEAQYVREFARVAYEARDIDVVKMKTQAESALSARGATHTRPCSAGTFCGMERPYYYSPQPGVAVVPVYGAIYAGAEDWQEYFFGVINPARIEKGIRDAAADCSIDTIVLDIDSPGGTVMGTGEVFDTLAQARKEKNVIAVTEGLAASAAYQLACGADEIFASVGALVGSIGTYISWADPTRMFKEWGIDFEVFKAGEHKAIGLPGRELTEADRALLQGEVEAMNTDFKSKVLSRRGKVADAVMQGQLHSARAALDTNLIDGVVRFDDVIALHLTSAQ